MGLPPLFFLVFLKATVKMELFFNNSSRLSNRWHCHTNPEVCYGFGESK